jgi:hypothetical protein
MQHLCARRDALKHVPRIRAGCVVTKKKRRLARYLQRKSERATYWCLVMDLISTRTLCGQPVRGAPAKHLRDRSPEYPICDLCRIEESEPEVKATVAGFEEARRRLRRPVL